MDRGTVYKGSIPFQRTGQRVLCLSGRKEQRRDCASELEVEADNTRAISLYERLGYEVLDYVQMIKDFE